MLPREQRLRRSTDFVETVRRGRRAARPLLTVHLLTVQPLPGAATAPEPVPARAGLVVGKAVGGSVVRSRTSRQLRHLLRPRMSELPLGSRLVVRAAPAAAGATSAELAVDLDAGIERACRSPRGARAADRPRAPR